VYLSGFSILFFVIAIIRESMLIGQLATGAKNSLEKAKMFKKLFLSFLKDHIRNALRKIP